MQSETQPTASDQRTSAFRSLTAASESSRLATMILGQETRTALRALSAVGDHNLALAIAIALGARLDDKARGDAIKQLCGMENAA